MKKTPDQYRAFKTLDFFHDDDFISSVKKGDIRQHSYWSEVGQRYPETMPYMEEAEAWIILLIRQPVYPATGQEASWQAIQGQIPQTERRRRFVNTIKLYSKRIAQAAAVAVFALAFYDLTQHGQKIKSTEYGQKNRIVLPDASGIDLNSNSSLRYVRNWKSDKPREVWLKGEALFYVKHLAVKNRVNQSDYFKVHAGGLLLTVTGTRFNVKDRRGVLRISLLEGSLRIEDENTQQLIADLKPGQSFTYDVDTQSQVSERIDPETITAWTNNEIRLDNTSLARVISDIEDNFGYRVVLQDSSLLNRHLSGTIPAKNLNDILFVLRQTLHVETAISGNQIIIK